SRDNKSAVLIIIVVQLLAILFSRLIQENCAHADTALGHDIWADQDTKRDLLLPC
ncbi:unnamed protein product, partial [Amoebophrya sp. A120]